MAQWKRLRVQQVVVAFAVALVFSFLIKDDAGMRTNSFVEEIKGVDLPRIQPWACIRTKPHTEREINWVMCGKTLERDEVVSGRIYSEGTYEVWDVELVLEMLKLYPKATFLDLGANIGYYTLAAAAVNASVIAVDPFTENLAYIRTSLELSFPKNNVRFVKNAISGKREPMYSWLPSDALNNEGGVNFLNKAEADLESPETGLLGDVVNSVLIQDILDLTEDPTVIIKMDLEGTDCKALWSLFESDTKTKFIPYILMEWQVVVVDPKVFCRGLAEFTQAFLKAGYFPVETASRKKIVFEPSKGLEVSSMNMLWVHSDAKKIPERDVVAVYVYSSPS